MLSSGAGASPKEPAPAGPPALSPADGAFLEGTQTVAAVPTAAGDDVVRLTVDGYDRDAEPTLGVSHLRFDVGSNSADVNFGNHFLVNGRRVDQPRTWVSERADLEIPNEFLVAGENTAEVVVGSTSAACGVNFDDFVMSDDLVGPGLTAGEHTLAVTVTDSLGNTATREVVFTSAGIPDRPTSRPAPERPGCPEP